MAKVVTTLLLAIILTGCFQAQYVSCDVVTGCRFCDVTTGQYAHVARTCVQQTQCYVTGCCVTDVTAIGGCDCSGGHCQITGERFDIYRSAGGCDGCVLGDCVLRQKADAATR